MTKIRYGSEFYYFGGNVGGEVFMFTFCEQIILSFVRMKLKIGGLIGECTLGNNHFSDNLTVTF